ncbi:MAG: hypothetical protein EOP10_08190 [Proteobacteria bacterium]|nr:MAG: hypothetical protein EOP10_08190 [Pseudomonadota bacterium]
MLKRSVILLALATTVLSGFKAPESVKESSEFKPHMQSIYASVVQLMPLFLADQSKMGGKEKERMETQLKNLAEQSQSIQKLALKSDASHMARARDLAVSSEAAYAQFKENRQGQSRFLLSDVLNTCFGCHTSRESEKDSQFVTNFNKDVKWQSLEPLARARFLALSRQFDASIKEYEVLLKSANISEDDFINLDPLVEYLILGLRVRNDRDRVENTLKSIKQDLYPQIVKNDINAWLKTLEDIKKEKPASRSMLEAKNQMSLAKQSIEYPQDRKGLVRYIIASRLLNEVVQDKSLPSIERAEAYYNLGLCENIIDVNYFSDQSLAYFEETIRLSPRSELSKKAFAQFEDIVRFSFSGSAGTSIPESEKEKMRSLKKLAL